MGVNWDRFRGAVGKLRGVADIQSAVETPALMQIPREIMDQLAQKAALSCTWMCRQMILGNMANAGIKSKGLTLAINAGLAVYHGGRGLVRFRLSKEVNPYPKAQSPAGDIGGVWMIAASQDAGRVAGLKGIQAARAKRRIKAGLGDQKTTRAVRQIHNGTPVERAAINLSSVTVVPGKNFFRFSAGQAAQIKAHFRKNLDGLVAKYKRGSQAKAV